jgi:hypothetical protein
MLTVVVPLDHLVCAHRGIPRWTIVHPRHWIWQFGSSARGQVVESLLCGGIPRSRTDRGE